MSTWSRGAGRALDHLLNRQRLLRRAALLWAMALITWSVRYAFVQRPDLPAGTVTALGLVTGLLGSVIAFYQHHRSQEDRARGPQENA